jgi:hypothetical protein
VALRQSLPQELRASASAPENARILLLALLAHAEPASREAQLRLVATQLGARAEDAVRLAITQVRLPSALHRLPAILQLFPSLRGLPDAERAALAGLLQQMIRADTRISVFEYSLEKLALRALDLRTGASAPHGRETLAERSGELGVVFAVLARHGARSDELARRAYEAGISALLPRQRPAYSVVEDWVPAFDRSLDALRSLQVTAKQLVVEALVRTIAHDGLLAPEEAELLRAICGVLECPLPPVLPA